VNAAEVLVVAGSVLILLAAIGVARFGDVLARMHALSKATTVGLVLVLVGGALGLHDMNSITFLVLGGALQVLTAPVGPTCWPGPPTGPRASPTRSTPSMSWPTSSTRTANTPTPARRTPARRRSTARWGLPGPVYGRAVPALCHTPRR
jgi:monovalent cation/proton antiporter MnhG/PhaG subunit